MLRIIKNNLVIGRIVFIFLSCLIWTTAQAASPLWTMIPVPGNNPSQTVPENRTATMAYTVQNQSSKPKKLVIQSIPGITQTAPCQLAPKGQAGSSCVLNLAISGSALPVNGVHGEPVLCQANADGSPNQNQCYQPSSANSLSITRGAAIFATISVNPTTLQFTENSTGQVTVTNSVSSLVAAENVVANIPLGSFISVQSTTCGPSLAIGASCTITFASGVQEGPTTIPVSGSNTNTVNINVTVNSQPVISITAPVQQSRVVTVSGSTLSLQIDNDAGSMINADAITVSNQAGCPNLLVNDSNCLSVPPGGSCLLDLTSTTPYAPCTITVSGSNTANSPTTLIAFFYQGGLVFQESGGSGKVVIDVAQEFQSRWTNTQGAIPTATDPNDGSLNTSIIVASSFCSTNTANCAAQRCRDISADWYLPARNELTAIQSALCSNAAIPCNFGGFSTPPAYWSSTAVTNVQASSLLFPTGSPANTAKTTSLNVRCVQAFPP